jgi:deoxycytidine triphosphate deaminase
MIKSAKQLEKLIDKNNELSKKVEDFEQLIDSIELDDKKRILFKKIYSNSIDDRNYANVLFTNALVTMNNSQEFHITVGPILAKYLERMSKSNEQILKLTELILSLKSKEEVIDIDELYKNME